MTVFDILPAPSHFQKAFILDHDDGYHNYIDNLTT